MWMTIELKKLLGGLCVLLAVLIPAALYLSYPEGDVLETGAWGLSFPTPGQPPVGNATEAELEILEEVMLVHHAVQKIVVKLGQVVY